MCVSPAFCWYASLVWSVTGRRPLPEGEKGCNCGSNPVRPLRARKEVSPGGNADGFVIHLHSLHSRFGSTLPGGPRIPLQRKRIVFTYQIFFFDCFYIIFAFDNMIN